MKVEFCPDPKSLGGRFTTTYDDAPGVNFASLNAGDERLNLGGATINLQFAKDLDKLAGQNSRTYVDLHSRVLQQDDAQVKKLYAASTESLQGDKNVELCFMRLLDKDQREGIAIIDVFNEAHRPHGCAENMAMVYTVGPQRNECSSDEDFLTRVQAAAANVSAALVEYNQQAGLKKIGKLRVCLVSGGAFAGRVAKESVAFALCTGLAEFCDSEHSPTFEFAYDGDAFRTAWEALQAQTTSTKEATPEA